MKAMINMASSELRIDKNQLKDNINKKSGNQIL